MKTNTLSLCCVFLWIGCRVMAQGDFDRVYAIFQQHCTGCHGSGQTAMLNLEGVGGQAEARKSDVYNRLVGKIPVNPGAAGAGKALVYPGRIDKSFLFHKINQGLDPYYTLNSPDEGEAMPPEGHAPLSDVEKETIRQWILYGAKRQGTSFETHLLEDYYNGSAIASFPDGPPSAPAEGEGIQLRMGPFYIPPTGEVEYFQKHELSLPFDAEIDRIDVLFGNFSHHFLLYDFDRDPGAKIPHGLRPDPLHEDVSLVMAFQSPESLRLPPKTAFFWDKNIVLDLNTHYINYSGSFVYQAEVYIHIYYKERGTALHEMNTALLPKTDIVIPNNEQTIRFEQTIANPALGEIFVWAMAGHTHKYGRSYKVYERTMSGAKGNLIYDGACAEGIPGCSAPYFDYQHIPFRMFQPLHALDLRRGFIHEATYRNDGSDTVRWGPTSDDEMMLLVVSYVTDTTGITTSSPALQDDLPVCRVYPNPTNGLLKVEWPEGFAGAVGVVYDRMGRIVLEKEQPHELDMSGRPAGIYLLEVRDSKTGRRMHSRFVFQPME
jgi:hypothetical protein